MKTAFITGIAGQDGSYLSEYLLSLGYHVTGIIRRNSTVEHQRHRVVHLNDLKLDYGDLLDPRSLTEALEKFQPDEIYNLGAQSHVRISTEIPQYTTQVNALGTLNLLEAYRKVCPQAKFYQASSSEIFGNNVDTDGFQRKTTPKDPVSPYGCSKLFAYHICRHYRKANNLAVTNGILFNHESPRRGSNFITTKVVIGAVKIYLGLADKLELGNLDAARDWGHAKDYIKAMHLMLQQPEAGDWVVATGTTHTVRELVKYVFSKLGLDYNKYVTCNPKFFRPEELRFLKGDASRIVELGWKPEYTFESMLDEMVEYQLTLSR